jgi:hypothetical protein
MRLFKTLLITGSLAVSLAACGTAAKNVVSGSGSNTTETTAPDTTSTAPPNPPPATASTPTKSDNSSTLDFGHAASPADQRAITKLVKRYFAVADAENGTAACSMLYSTLAESVPEDYGRSPPGQPYMRGTTCPAVMTLLFKHFHSLIALEYPRLRVARVRLIEHHGLAVLRFRGLPEREIYVAREGHTWRISMILDGAVS